MSKQLVKTQSPAPRAVSKAITPNTR